MTSQRMTRRLNPTIPALLLCLPAFGGVLLSSRAALTSTLMIGLLIGLPKSTPVHDEVVSVAFAVVAFSVIVQGVTMTPLLRKLGAITPAASDFPNSASTKTAP
jgi:NhaP-type Na+/H+ or K+/H+ antiporter